MRTFGRVETSIWQNWKFHQFSDDEKLLWIYLIACPHGNALGCFILHDGYVASDLRWTFERASKALSKLCGRERIERDERTGITRVVGWFGHNRLENTNVVKGILATIKTLPRCSVLANAIKALLDEGGHFVDPFRECLESSLKDLSEGLGNTFEPPEPEPEPEPETKPEIDSSANADSSASADLPAPNGVGSRDVPSEMVAVWNHELGDLLPKPRKLDQTRKAKLARRLKEDFRDDIADWRDYCQRIRGSPHLIGENDRGWKADLDWCLEPRNVNRILEGRYDRNPAQQSITYAERLAAEHKRRFD